VSDFELSRAQFLARAAAPDIPANVLKLGYVIAYKRMAAKRLLLAKRRWLLT
jgi:hypothetical protein